MTLGLLLSVAVAMGQSNFSVKVGGMSAADEDGNVHWGTTFGLSGKFNVLPIIRVRSQFNVDRVTLRDIVLDDFQGDQTVNFVCLGLGPEFGVGSEEINGTAHVIFHGNIRTATRVYSTDQVASLTRFSLGLVAGAGVEFYVTDNLGVEAEGEFALYNFDHTERLDPAYHGWRVTLGMQFYLGRNFVKEKE